MIFALHGNVGSTSDFDFLSDLTNVKAVDLWPMSHLSLRDAAAEIRKMAKGGEPQGLLGYSMGGRIALQALTDDPHFWDFAIIMSAHPGLVSETEREERRKKDREWADLIRASGWTEFLAKWNAQSVLSGAISSGQNGLEARQADIAKAFQNWSLGKQENLRTGLKDFRGPITWIAGEHDPKFATLAEDVCADLLNSDLEIIPNCGHRVLLENPQRIREITLGKDW